MKWVESNYVFYFLLLLNLFFICSTRFYPSMDGPAHLYNSNLLFHLLSGNPSVTEYFTINTLPVPNWLSHFILLLFNSMLPGWMAEKCLLILYITGMAFSFKYLVQQMNPEAKPLSILIFPFIYSFLFHLGFYNNSLSFIFFFYTLGYWFRHFDAMQFRHYLIIFLLLTLTYFTSSVSFALTGFLMGIHIVLRGYRHFLMYRNLKNTLALIVKRLGLLLWVSLPGIILLIIFIIHTGFNGTNSHYTPAELIKWINDARPFIVYNYTGEEVLTEQYFHALLMLGIFGFMLKRYEKNIPNPGIKDENLFIFPLLLVLVLYFFIPNGANAGMMSDRFCLLIYMLLLIWIAVNIKPSFIVNAVVIFMILIHAGLLVKHHNGSIKRLSKDANLVNEAADHIKPGSVVYPVNLSDNWLEIHFSNYLGIDKPMIILENYEASVGWFPVKWKDQIYNFTSTDDSSSILKGDVDYVLLYGNKSRNEQKAAVMLNQTKPVQFRQIFINDFVILLEKLPN